MSTRTNNHKLNLRLIGAKSSISPPTFTSPSSSCLRYLRARSIRFHSRLSFSTNQWTSPSTPSPPSSSSTRTASASSQNVTIKRTFYLRNVLQTRKSNEHSRKVYRKRLKIRRRVYGEPTFTISCTHLRIGRLTLARWFLESRGRVLWVNPASRKRLNPL